MDRFADEEKKKKREASLMTVVICSLLCDEPDPVSAAGVCEVGCARTC